MTIDELKFFVELLTAYYGEDYIQTFEQLSEMLKLEFDIDTSAKELSMLTQMSLDTEDVIINMSTCGIFY